MIFKHIVKVGSFTTISRILGVFRDIVIAKLLGASYFSDAFFIAFKLPNVFRRLFAEGSLNSVFIPIFSKLLANNNIKQAKRFSNEVFTILFIILLSVVIIMEIFMPSVLLVIAPGFNKREPQAYSLAVHLTRITLPYLFFISIVTLFSSILNSIKKFAVVAMLPILLNISIIVFFLYSGIESLDKYVAYFGSYGIVFAGIIQLLVIAIYTGFNGWFIKFVCIKKISKDTISFFKRVIPVIITAGVYQINVFIDITIASWLTSGAITYLYYGDRLNQLPLAIIGIATSTVIVPFISGAKKYDREKNNKLKLDAILYGILLGLPAVLGFLILGHEIINILFDHGKFDAESVNQTYYVLCAYSLGLIPNIIIKIIISIFYAEHDSNTPFFINSIILIFNTLLAILLSYYFGYIGIAIATSCSSIVNFIVLFMLLVKRDLIYLNKYFFNEIIKGIFIIFLLFGIVIVLKYLILFVNDYYFYNIRLFYIISFIFLIFITVFLYLFALKVIKSSIYMEIKAIFSRKDK